MSDARTISVIPDPLRALSYDVVIREGRSETRHRVTMSADDAARWRKLGAGPEGCAKAAMLFLIDREPKESILTVFDIGVIQRYFPEFNGAFPDYLARLGRDEGERAQT